MKQTKSRNRSQWPTGDLRHWMDRVYRTKFHRDGRVLENKYYTVRIRRGDFDETFPLGTSNKTAAATQAREIHIYLQANGGQATLEKFKKKIEPACPLTVGGLIAEVQKHLDVRPTTFADYARALRYIAAGIAGVESTNAKFDYQRGGHAAWLEKVNSVPLSHLTPEAIAKWRSQFLSRAKGDPRKLQQLRASCNSFLRDARSLFSRKVLKHLKGITESPFAEIKSGSASMRYRSTIDFEQLLSTAAVELESHVETREEFKAFLLAACAGLRRNEIDLLPWSAINFDKNIIRIETTEHFEGKSLASHEDVSIDPEVSSLFRGWRAQARDRFVIESQVQPRIGATYNHYRCQRVFDSLICWLRKQGVNTNSPIHTLRKEYGSHLTATHGVFVASRALRHSSVQVTEQFYASQKGRVSLGLGHLLATKPDNIIELGVQTGEAVSNV
jgi:integrase